MTSKDSNVTQDTADQPVKSWYDAFPKPSLSADQIPVLQRSEILSMLKSQTDSEKLDFLLIDVRRADHEGGQIRGSLNVPAQSMYYCMPTLYKLFKNSNVKMLVWFCGSSSGRGPRSAGWFHDYCKSLGDEDIKNVVLAGGIKGWVASGQEYIQWMDGYDATAWTREK